MAREYTSIEEISNYLTLNIDENFESQLEKWIEAMSDYVSNYTNREWSVTEVETRLYTGNNTNNISIDEAISIVSVEMGGDDITDDVESYPLNSLPIRRLFYRNGIFLKDYGNIAVEGIFGASSTIPEDIRFITTVLVAGIILAQTQQEGEVKSEKIGNYSVTYDTESQKSDYEMAKQMLNVRRKLVI